MHVDTKNVARGTRADAERKHLNSVSPFGHMKAVDHAHKHGIVGPQSSIDEDVPLRGILWIRNASQGAVQGSCTSCETDVNETESIIALAVQVRRLEDPSAVPGHVDSRNGERDSPPVENLTKSALPKNLPQRAFELHRTIGEVPRPRAHLPNRTQDPFWHLQWENGPATATVESRYLVERNACGQRTRDYPARARPNDKIERLPDVEPPASTALGRLLGHREQW